MVMISKLDLTKEENKKVNVVKAKLELTNKNDAIKRIIKDFVGLGVTKIE